MQQGTHWEYTDKEDRCTESDFSGNDLSDFFGKGRNISPEQNLCI